MSGRRERKGWIAIEHSFGVCYGHAPRDDSIRSYDINKTLTSTHVKISHPPSFPLLTGNLIPTAPLFPIPPQNRPNVAFNGFPNLPPNVASRANNQSAFPPCETRETRR